MYRIEYFFSAIVIKLYWVEYFYSAIVIKLYWVEYFCYSKLVIYTKNVYTE